MLSKCSESNLHLWLRLDMDLGCRRLYTIINFFLLPFYGLHSFQNLSTHCTRCYNREAPIYKPKLTKRPTQAAVLDFINQLQCRYTNAQHQPQINVAHSNTSGHSDVATFLLAKKQLILQAHWNAYILSFSLSEWSRVFWYQIWSYRNLQVPFQGTFMVADTTGLLVYTDFCYRVLYGFMFIIIINIQ